MLAGRNFGKTLVRVSEDTTRPGTLPGTRWEPRRTQARIPRDSVATC